MSLEFMSNAKPNHYVTEAQENLRSKQSSVKYLNDAINSENIELWEKKEYQAVLADTLIELKQAEIRLNNCLELVAS